VLAVAGTLISCFAHFLLGRGLADTVAQVTKRL
jgi:uncharacterized membrane protein YdjX (TVP38/TMEM64 family)